MVDHIPVAQFDVQRKDKKRYHRGVVSEVDFESDIKKICFRFKDGYTEWVDFGSRAICPFRSKLKKRESRATKTTNMSTEIGYVDSTISMHGSVEGCEQGLQSFGERKPSPTRTETSSYIDTATAYGIDNEGKNHNLPTKRFRKLKEPSDPSDENSFVVGGKYFVILIAT
jgi:hypothetical protein